MPSKNEIPNIPDPSPTNLLYSQNTLILFYNSGLHL